MIPHVILIAAGVAAAFWIKEKYDAKLRENGGGGSGRDRRSEQGRGSGQHYRENLTPSESSKSTEIQGTKNNEFPSIDETDLAVGTGGAGDDRGGEPNPATETGSEQERVNEQNTDPENPPSEPEK